MKQWRSIVVLTLLLVVSVWLVVSPLPLQYITATLAKMGIWSYGAYVVLLAGAVVFAPVTVMPLIPLATTMFGPFLTGLLSVVGWTLGAVVAFLIARVYGRPLLEHFVAMEKVDRLVEKFPPRAHFLSIFLMRHLLPVDVLSYALGLVPSIRFSTYTFATLFGVTWFSFAFAYLGEAIFTGNLWVFLEIGLASLAILAVAWYMLKNHKNN